MSIVASLTDEPLSVERVVAAAGDKRAGAVVSFAGTVRRSSSVAADRDDDVVALFYEAHLPQAESRLQEIATTAAQRWNLLSAVVVHRLGRCHLGEPTVVIACASEHRDEAFVSCRWIIEQLKASVPIWKCEIYPDGEHWVGMGS